MSASVRVYSSMAALVLMVLGLSPSCRKCSGEDRFGRALAAETGGVNRETVQRAFSENWEAAEVLYDKEFKNGWQDWGWGPHEVAPGRPIRVRFDSWGGLILAKPGNTGSFGGLAFRIRLPKDELDFLSIHLESNGALLPVVALTPDYARARSDGWLEVRVPFALINPESLETVDRIILNARRQVVPRYVELDQIVLVKPNASGNSPEARVVERVRPVALSVDCRQNGPRVNPRIFGFAYYPFQSEQAQAEQWSLRGTIRRWGGNVTSTYNWEAGAWNLGSDWYFENQRSSHQQFFLENDQHGIQAAVTVPILGWVAKDTTSNSFSISARGPQAASDPYRPDAGNGVDRLGKSLVAGPQTQAYRVITPEFVARWVQAIRRSDVQRGRRSVWMYILDNEPMIWNSTHRDAHPEPLGYDELVLRTIAYGTAVREADPEAVIAGPAEWGWPGYLYSAKDLAHGGTFLRPDRRMHGDLPVVAYYLRALAEHEKRTGVRVLDVLDLHSYPYAPGVHGEMADPATAERRIRSTQMLWNPEYVDESWVNEPVMLLPRMKEWIERYYPGLGMSIGEWNFGGERHISGALAAAEALGRYAQFGVTSAFYWTYPPQSSEVMWAFRAYRDFDGNGAQFLEWYVPSSVPKAVPISLFASRDDPTTHVVAVLLNRSSLETYSAKVSVSTCGNVKTARAYMHDKKTKGFDSHDVTVPDAVTLAVALPPYSISVLDVRLTAR